MMKVKQFFFGVLLAIFAGAYITIANSSFWLVDVGALTANFFRETCIELHGMMQEIFGDDQ